LQVYHKVLQEPITSICWVRLGSSTCNVLWSWNNKERRLRLLWRK